MKSVEKYDYYENKWTFLPDMNKERSQHAAVSMGNKIFVIGGCYTTSSEVFDSCSRKFTKIKSFVKLSAIDKSYFKAVCVGSYIFVIRGLFNSEETIIHIYDVDKQMWSNVDSEICKNLYGSNCVKYYTQ